MKARGNITVGINWKEAKLVKVSLKSIKNQTIIVRYGNLKKEVTLKAEKETVFDGASFQ
ncbi:hypothetical protein ADIARSV_4251 [Arcticibacter svalbardensis MN12-7]|uniref:Alpha fucosidase A-like C-terminal domain-containing protein n=1 Tax=Arcticibacter svalbardensis MN12-7 TaxID=1150600 RepID=R9GUZ4_9SPHI|nr:hypothetical protein [Arcticibacter svalbardensis]EOR92739.1 hypothetical protein ADIARSV_4251 [Arcticibacter svalbardensis MN12-7]